MTAIGSALEQRFGHLLAQREQVAKPVAVSRQS